MMENIVRRRPAPNPQFPDKPLLRCAFTGHRPQKLPFGFNESSPLCVDFKKRLTEAIEKLINEGYSHFLSGGALGMDMFAAEAVLQLRSRYPHIALEMVIPFDGQADKWTAAYQRRYYHILSSADIITCTGHAYSASCMSVRNRYLVNNADLLLAAFDGHPGGTAQTVNYAGEIGIPVFVFPSHVMRKSLKMPA